MVDGSEPQEEPFDTGLTPAEFDPTRPQPYETPWGTFSIYALGEGVVAADTWCPHMLGPLYEGSVADGRITCPWHSWVFSLETGRCVWAPDSATGNDSTLRLCSVSLGPGGTYWIHPPSVPAS